MKKKEPPDRSQGACHRTLQEHHLLRWCKMKMGTGARRENVHSRPGRKKTMRSILPLPNFATAILAYTSLECNSHLTNLILSPYM